MELSFVFSALRRYFWVVILFGVLGALPGLLRPGEVGGLFESTAVLLVAPSTESRVQTSSGDADRYIAGQLSVMSSESLAEQVAQRVTEELGDDEYTAEGVRGVTDFTHQPGTDIVNITAATPRPDVSQAIGNAYVDEYFAALRTQVDETQEPEIEQLTERRDSVRQRLADVDEQLQAAILPYLTVGPVPEGEVLPAVPTPEQVAPGLVSERAILLTDLEQASETLAQLETSARLRVASEVVQRATLPTEPEPTPANRLLIAGIVGGCFAGLLCAIILARLSRRVLDEAQAADILGQPIVGVLASARPLARDRRSAVEHPPPNVVPLINALCVRAQLDHGAESLSVLVVGTRSGAGATTLAGAVANRFAATGASVLLVDADPRHPELTELYSVLRALEPRTDEAAGDHGGDAILQRAQRIGAIRPTAVGNLLVARVGEDSQRRPQRVTDLFESIKSWFDVVVFDGGSLLASASTVQLARLTDSVILAVPRRQTVRGLNAVAWTLERRDFLPVWTPVGRRRRHVARRRQDPENGQEGVKTPEEALVTSP